MGWFKPVSRVAIQGQWPLNAALARRNTTAALDGRSSAQASQDRIEAITKSTADATALARYQSDPKSVARFAPNHQQHLARRFQAVRSLVAAQRALHVGPGGIFRSL